MGPSWGLSSLHVGLKLIYAGGEKCRKTRCFELFSKLSARRGGLNWPHVGGVNWLTLRLKLASCWFLLGAEKRGKTLCFELFSKLWLVT